MDDFLPGQRWISESESELGVGTVTERDARCVHIHFPATGEDRIYSRREAPLARVGFAVGDRLKDQSGRDLLVKAVHEQNGLRFYDCEDIDGNPALVTEADIYDHMRLNRPEQKLLGGRIDRDIWFTLRYQTWLQGARLATLPGNKQREFARVYAREVPRKLSATIKALKKQITDEAPKMATRKSSETVLEVVNPIMPETVGGSADLTGSNNTKTGDLGVFTPENRSGRYIYYGIREHGMAAAMNGMALHGGIRPYGGTFMCFTDYARPAMRLAALMRIPTVFVMTHDSIGLGEDGPTHQPVEHLAISRATPNTYVFRPADTVETAEAWELALSAKETPSVLSLTRQGVPTVRTEHKTKNLTAQGAYVLADAEGKRQAILLATGSEVAIALAARDILQEAGIGTRVVSMPCWELFAAQDETYRKRVLPGGPVRVAVEAGVQLGWDQWLTGERGKSTKAGFIGMEGFGASAPAEVLYEKFGITAQAVADKVKSLL